MTTTQLKEPTPAMVMTGYQLEKYARKGTKYLWAAFECIDTAIGEAKVAGEDINLLDLVEERQAIIELIKITQESQKIHKALSNRLAEAGYRKINDTDFAQLGAGSRR